MHNQIIELIESRGIFFRNYDILEMTPRDSGIYCFWLGENTSFPPLYVGKSKNIRRRLLEHRAECHNEVLRKYIKAFPNLIIVKFIRETKFNRINKLSKIEKTIIQKLQPLTNRTFNN